jgi:hypothetical protein
MIQPQHVEGNAMVNPSIIDKPTHNFKPKITSYHGMHKSLTSG